MKGEAVMKEAYYVVCYRDWYHGCGKSTQVYWQKASAIKHAQQMLQNTWCMSASVYEIPVMNSTTSSYSNELEQGKKIFLITK